MLCIAVAIVCFLCMLLLLRKRRMQKLVESCFARLDSVGYRRDHALRYFPTTLHAMAAEKKPYRKGFLFLGGFGDTPALWKFLTPFIQDAGHLFVCPRTPGWGRSDFDEVMAVSWREWVLSGLEAVAVLKGLCDEVVIVGHSTGALVAAMVAEREPVSRLVFTGPNLATEASDMWAKKLFLHPYIGAALTWLLAVMPKKKRLDRPIDMLNEAYYAEGWYLTAFPLPALRSMWLLQEQLSRRWQVKSVSIMMGEMDRSVGPLEAQVRVARRFLPPDAELRHWYISGAAHGLPCETRSVLEQVAAEILRV